MNDWIKIDHQTWITKPGYYAIILKDWNGEYRVSIAECSCSKCIFGVFPQLKLINKRRFSEVAIAYKKLTIDIPDEYISDNIIPRPLKPGCYYCTICDKTNDGAIRSIHKVLYYKIDEEGWYSINNHGALEKFIGEVTSYKPLEEL